jgi:hypothetical protein
MRVAEVIDHELLWLPQVSRQQNAVAITYKARCRVEVHARLGQTRARSHDEGSQGKLLSWVIET